MDRRGGSLSLLGIAGLRWWSKNKHQADLEQDERDVGYWAWSFVLAGLALIVLRLPQAIGAPLSVLMITDSVSVALMIGVLVMVIRMCRLRSRRDRAVSGPSDANQR